MSSVDTEEVFEVVVVAAIGGAFGAAATSFLPLQDVVIGYLLVTVWALLAIYIPRWWGFDE